VADDLKEFEKEPIKPEFKIHDPNPFVPGDLSLRAPKQPRPGDFLISVSLTSKSFGLVFLPASDVMLGVGEPVPGPILIRDTPSWKVFHKLDQTFGRPRVYAAFQVMWQFSSCKDSDATKISFGDDYRVFCDICRLPPLRQIALPGMSHWHCC